MTVMNEEIALRPASADDLGTLIEIQRAASLKAFAQVFPPDRHPFPTEVVRARWVGALAEDGVHVLLAEKAGDGVGFAAVRAEWLDGLYVLPELWGSGVGARLHDAAVEILRGLGGVRSHLWVLEANSRARTFYERRGWALNGQTRVVPFAPRPLDVGYSLELGELAAPTLPRW